MEKSRSLIRVLLAAALLATTGYAQDSHPVTHRPYADVSGGPDWLNRPSRDHEEHTDEALDLIGIEKGSTVADVGCGPGYMTSRMARRVGQQGIVYGEDIQPSMLRELDKNMRSQGLNNVRPILGTDSDPKLPKEAIDLILLVDVYHEFNKPQIMLRKMLEALKPNGRLVLLEYRAEDPNVPIREVHKMTVPMVQKEIEPEGYKLDKVIEGLPWQHIIVFRKPAS